MGWEQLLLADGILFWKCSVTLPAHTCFLLNLTLISIYFRIKIRYVRMSHLGVSSGFGGLGEMRDVKVWGGACVGRPLYVGFPWDVAHTSGPQVWPTVYAVIQGAHIPIESPGTQSLYNLPDPAALNMMCRLRRYTSQPSHSQVRNILRPTSTFLSGTFASGHKKLGCSPSTELGLMDSSRLPSDPLSWTPAITVTLQFGDLGASILDCVSSSQPHPGKRHSSLLWDFPTQLGIPRC